MRKAQGGSVQKNPYDTDSAAEPDAVKRRTINIFGRKVAIPQSRPARISVGVGLVLGGTLGFLPVLGFWMVPLGLLVLSHDFGRIRRLRRRTSVIWAKRRRKSPGPPA